MFRAIGLPTFTKDPSVLRAYSDPNQAIVLLLLRDSCGLIPRGNISHHNDPIAAFQTLTTLYKPNDKLKRDRLIQVFYSLKYTIGTNLSTFNTKFNAIVAKLAKKGAKIEPINYCNNYLRAFKKDYTS